MTPARVAAPLGLGIWPSINVICIVVITIALICIIVITIVLANFHASFAIKCITASSDYYHLISLPTVILNLTCDK